MILNSKLLFAVIAVGIAITAIVSALSFSENEITQNVTTNDSQITQDSAGKDLAPLKTSESLQLDTKPVPIKSEVSDEPKPTSIKSEISDDVMEPSNDIPIMVTNGEKHLIPLNKIKSGGPPKDGIPSIDDPKFVSALDADFVSDSDIVIGLEIDGDARAYPLFILVWHEIVNDEVGNLPVTVTYCPLCFTNQVFERIVDGNAVEFGTSGKLYNSNLVMYDRMTGSYWSQALGMAIKGELTGYQLEIVPFDVISFGDWKKIHPDSLVLTTKTGHVRAYGVDPYGSYYTDPRIIFPVENEDDRMHPKEIILGFSVGDTYKAYRQNEVEEKVVINDSIDSASLLLVSLYDENARAFDRMISDKILDFEFSDGKIIDTQTRSQWNYDGVAISGPLEGERLERLGFNPGFWFEWVAFHPDTLVYGDV